VLRELVARRRFEYSQDAERRFRTRCPSGRDASPWTTKAALKTLRPSSTGSGCYRGTGVRQRIRLRQAHQRPTIWTLTDCCAVDAGDARHATDVSGRATSCPRRVKKVHDYGRIAAGRSSAGQREDPRDQLLRF
jgi:hypothetical protein